MALALNFLCIYGYVMLLVLTFALYGTFSFFFYIAGVNEKFQLWLPIKLCCVVLRCVVLCCVVLYCIVSLTNSSCILQLDFQHLHRCCNNDLQVTDKDR